MSDAITCPKCGNCESRVKDSRSHVNYIRRRRACRTCKFRFNTYEAVGNRPSADIDKLTKRLGKAHEAARKLLDAAETVKVLTQ